MFVSIADGFHDGWEMFDINGWKTLPSKNKITKVVELCDIDGFLESEENEPYEYASSAFTETIVGVV